MGRSGWDCGRNEGVENESGKRSGGQEERKAKQNGTSPGMKQNGRGGRCRAGEWAWVRPH